MNVYFLGSDYEGCYYVRCMLPLQQNGWDGDRITLYSTSQSNDMRMKGAMNADIIVFQRPLQREKIEAAKLLKKAGKKIVMDNDDTYIPESGVPTVMLGTKEDKRDVIATMDSLLKEFASLSDLITVSTDFLAQEYRDVNTHVEVLPNMVDPNDWDKPLKNSSDTVRIGLVGSVVGNDDYRALQQSLLGAIKGNPKVQLVLFALPPDTEDYKYVRKNAYQDAIDYWNKHDVEWHHFVPMKNYMRTLNELRLDIMLIPRANTYFNRAKSNIKYLEASMLEIPVIAQGFSDNQSPYQKDIDGSNGLIAYTDDDWREMTLDLINNKRKRVKMGKKARKYVLKHYDITKKDNYMKWHNAYKSLME